jgi:hypothetical protein
MYCTYAAKVRRLVLTFKLLIIPVSATEVARHPMLERTKCNKQITRDLCK